MKVFEYENKELKKKSRAIDVESILADMDELEQFYGSGKDKVYEHWYALKRELANALVMEIEENKK